MPGSVEGIMRPATDFDQRANVSKGLPTQGLLNKWQVCLTLQFPRVFETSFIDTAARHILFTPGG